MLNFFVYILKCKDGSYYIGHTQELEQRLNEHKAGFYKGYTSLRLPLELVYKAEFTSREEAFIVERKIKKWSRKKKEALINGDFELLKVHAKKNFNDLT